ncbi:hypothetical protein D3C76_1008310 [compost metagenome]
MTTLNNFSTRRHQTGASLFIALIILLLITVLALSSIREVTLESRITGNLVDQQRLANAAEAGLRDGEYGMTDRITPLEPTSACTAATEGRAPAPCLLKLQNNSYTYNLLFNSSSKVRPYYPDDGTQFPSNVTVSWYALPAPTGSESAEAENPEYGNMLNQTGTFRYEVNSRAVNSSSNNSAYLRSTTAKLFDNGN